MGKTAYSGFFSGTLGDSIRVIIIDNFRVSTSGNAYIIPDKFPFLKSFYYIIFRVLFPRGFFRIQEIQKPATKPYRHHQWDYEKVSFQS